MALLAAQFCAEEQVNSISSSPMNDEGVRVNLLELLQLTCYVNTNIDRSSEHPARSSDKAKSKARSSHKFAGKNQGRSEDRDGRVPGFRDSDDVNLTRGLFTGNKSRHGLLLRLSQSHEYLVGRAQDDDRRESERETICV